jgi:hypothetical protein
VQLREQLAKLGQLESASNQKEELIMLKSLVALNESLKQQEAAFKASCKAQMADLTARIKAIDDSDAQGIVTDEDKKLNDIEDMYSKVILQEVFLFPPSLSLIFIRIFRSLLSIIVSGKR